MPETYPTPRIIVHVREIGQVCVVDHIEMTHIGNDNGVSAEAWTRAAQLLSQAALQAIEEAEK